MCEILAPAGNFKSAMAAINSGADAIYLGLTRFSARSSAENFSKEQFEEISSLARIFKVKVYVAMNTLVKDCELEDFLNSLVEIWNIGADAIILSDVFLGKFIKRYYPQIKIHLSTQAGICNTYGAEFAKKCGFERVILARETKLSDIAAISKIIETEVFVQGALCTCFSGQCYLSSFAGGYSGNRGRCKQPCRKKYSIDRNGFDTPAYRLSLADLCIGENIEKLKEAGVKSFKIEGRMRRPEYVAAAVKYYKNLFNCSVGETDFSDLKRTYNRGNYTRGLAFGQDKNFISAEVQGHIGEFVGVIQIENGSYICFSKQKFCKGDSFKIIRGVKEICGADFIKNVKYGFVISAKFKLNSGDKVFITTDTEVNRRLLANRRKFSIEVSARFMAGEKPKISVGDLDIYGINPLEKAVKSPLTVEDIKNCFAKADKLPFEISFGDMITDGVFLPKSELNSLRRTVYEEVFKQLSENNKVKLTDKFILPDLNNFKNDKTAVICSEFNKIKTDIAILKPQDFSKIDCHSYGFEGEKYLYLPPYMSDCEIGNLTGTINNFDGIYGDGIWSIELAERLKKPLFAGCGMNISNKVDICECNSEYIVLSKELTEKEQAALSTQNTFTLTSGAVKVMDLIYCPFGKKCNSCDKREIYILSDEDGRRFPMRRYKTSECRFEIYNCAYLVGVPVTGSLIDCSVISDVENAVKISGDVQKQQIFYKNYTRGHGNSPII